MKRSLGLWLTTLLIVVCLASSCTSHGSGTSVTNSSPAPSSSANGESGTQTPTASSTSSSSSSGSGVLTLTSSDPSTLDPAMAADALSASYIVEIFGGLMKLDSTLEPVPDIAQSMPSVSPDGLTYTFQLRHDVKFQDGRPVTANDFRYSWERAANPATGSPTAATYLGDIVGVKDMLAGKANQISGVRVVDDYTLQVTIQSPESYFLDELAYPISFVVDQANVSSGANWWQKPVGTGPFAMQEWKKGTDIILARNGSYYGNKAKLAQVKMILNSTYSDEDLFETGQIDVAAASPAYYDEIMDKTGPFYNDLAVSPQLSVDYIGFNCKEAPFDDPNVREAFTLAIDKDKIISLCDRNMAQKAQGILPVGMPGYNANLSGLSYDVTKAQELIKASKYGDASNLPPITLAIPGTGASAGPVVQSLVYQWKQNLGASVTVRELEPDAYDANPLQDSDQMYYFGWIADYPYPQDFLDILFSSGAAFNYGTYSNPKVDSLIQQANQAPNSTQALPVYQQAEQQIVSEAGCLPLTFGQDYLLIQPYVKNLSENALGIIDFSDVTIAPH